LLTFLAELRWLVAQNMPDIRDQLGRLLHHVAARGGAPPIDQGDSRGDDSRRKEPETTLAQQN